MKVERDGQVFSSNGESVGGAYRPIVFMVPRAGDVVHVLVEGVEKAVVTYDGRPALDGGCLVQNARTFEGTFTAGQDASVDFVRKSAVASFEPAERAAVTLAGDRFAATFGEPPGGELEITSHRTVPRADDGTIAVHLLLRPVRRCPAKTVATRIERPGRARRARRQLHARPPHGLSSGAGLLSRVRAGPRDGEEEFAGRDLGSRDYEVKGGSRALARARLSSAGRTTLRRRGRVGVIADVAIIAPPVPPPGILGKSAKTRANVTLVAPR